MKSKSQTGYFLQTILTCLCLIISVYAATPLTSKSASNNRKYKSGCVTQYDTRAPSRTLHVSGNNVRSKSGPFPSFDLKNNGKAAPHLNGNNLQNNLRPHSRLDSLNSSPNQRNLQLQPTTRSIPLQSPPKSNNTTAGNKSPFNNTSKFSKPERADAVAVVLKRSGKNEKNGSKLNTTVIAYNNRANKSPFNNTTKFLTAGRADAVPVVLKQSGVNASNTSRMNTTVSAHLAGNKSPFNNPEKFAKAGRTDVMPVVLKENGVNANNRSKTNTTVSANLGGNKSPFNSTKKFFNAGKSDVIPAVLKQPVNNRLKLFSTQTPTLQIPQDHASAGYGNEMRMAEPLPFWTPDYASSETGFNDFNSRFSSDGKGVSSILKNVFKRLKTSDRNSFTLDYGTPMKNNGSNLKLFGGKIVNVITGCLISITIIRAAL